MLLFLPCPVRLRSVVPAGVVAAVVTVVAVVAVVADAVAAVAAVFRQQLPFTNACYYMTVFFVDSSERETKLPCAFRLEIGHWQNTHVFAV